MTIMITTTRTMMKTIIIMIIVRYDGTTGNKTHIIRTTYILICNKFHNS